LDGAKAIGRGSNGIKQGPQGDAKAVLAELVDLLDEYGPSWYTEDHHNRVLAALHEPEPPQSRRAPAEPAFPTE
jgi:hypothetical protein